MHEVIWIAVFVAVTAIGIGIMVSRRSRVWVAAGIAYVLGGIGYQTYIKMLLRAGLDREEKVRRRA